MNEEKTVSPEDTASVGNRPLDDSELTKVVGGTGGENPGLLACDLDVDQPQPGQTTSLSQLGGSGS